MYILLYDTQISPFLLNYAYNELTTTSPLIHNYTSPLVGNYFTHSQLLHRSFPTPLLQPITAKLVHS